MDSLFEKQYRLEDLLPLIQEGLASGKTVKFGPRGVSMLPMLRQGIDNVILSPVPAKLKKYDLPLYRRSSGQFVLHRIVEVGECYTCVGDNQFDLERGLRHEQMIALVTAFTRGDRVIPVTDPCYRFYCRFWHYSRPLRRLWRRGVAFLRRLLK
jgi:hypothetical protein